MQKAGGTTMRDTGEMPDSIPHQIVHFHHTHYDAVARGDKLTTVRWAEAVGVGPALFIFDGHPTAVPLRGHVTEVEPYPLAQFTAEHARQPPGTDMVEFAAALRRNYYPTMPSDAVVEVVVIAVEHPGAAAGTVSHG